MDSELGESYRNLWDEHVKNPTSRADADLVLKCQYHGADQRDGEDHAVTRECAPCGTAGKPKKLKVFRCEHPNVTNKDVTIRDCMACEYRPRAEPKAAPLCECTVPGPCPRYGRDMYGRDFEICQGKNIDVGQAAQLRAIWRQGRTTEAALVHQVGECPFVGPNVLEGEKQKLEPACCGRNPLPLFQCKHPAREPEEVTTETCKTCVYRPKKLDNPRILLISCKESPGDACVMSAAIYSLHQANPGKFVTAVDTPAPAVWEHNPDIVTVDKARELGKVEEMQAHYPAINRSNQTAIHFMEGYCRFFEAALGVSVPLATNRPMIYLSKREKTWMSQVHEKTNRNQPFWLISCGHKMDYTAKFWGTDAYQRVVDLLRGRVLFVQVGASEHKHYPLRGVLNMIGLTDQRQLIRLAWNSQGGLGGVTFLQHIYAGVERPYVCILGGREPVVWNAYPKQRILHTIGSLPCCREGGCWKSRVTKLNDGDQQDNSLCDHPTFDEPAVGKCMAIISPELVVQTVLSML